MLNFENKKSFKFQSYSEVRKNKSNCEYFTSLKIKQCYIKNHRWTSKKILSIVDNEKALPLKLLLKNHIFSCLFYSSLIYHDQSHAWPLSIFPPHYSSHIYLRELINLFTWRGWERKNAILSKAWKIEREKKNC